MELPADVDPGNVYILKKQAALSGGIFAHIMDQNIPRLEYFYSILLYQKNGVLFSALPNIAFPLLSMKLALRGCHPVRSTLCSKQLTPRNVHRELS